MADCESPLQSAERHVSEAQARIARQEDICAELEQDGHPATAAAAWTTLFTLRETLAIAREHLRHEREMAAKPR